MFFVVTCCGVPDVLDVSAPLDPTLRDEGARGQDIFLLDAVCLISLPASEVCQPRGCAWCHASSSFMAAAARCLFCLCLNLFYSPCRRHTHTHMLPGPYFKDPHSSWRRCTKLFGREGSRVLSRGADYSRLVPCAREPLVSLVRSLPESITCCCQSSEQPRNLLESERPLSNVVHYHTFGARVSRKHSPPLARSGMP